MQNSQQVSLLTLSAGDVIADMLLSSVVQRDQELVKLIVGLATEHRQQLLILSERYHLRVDGMPFFRVENLSLIKFTDKSRMLGIKIVHQEHVMVTDNSCVNKSIIKV